MVRYQGDISNESGLPFPVYIFGSLNNSPATIDSFLIIDLTPLDTGLGVVLLKLTGTVIPNNSITVRRGFENYGGRIDYTRNDVSRGRGV